MPLHSSLSLHRCTALAAAVMAATVVLHRPALAAPTTAPSTQPTGSPRTDAAISADLKQVSMDLNATLPPMSISDPAKRAVAAPTAIPLIKQEESLLGEFGAAHHSEKAYAMILQRFDAMLYLLGDKETVDKVDAASAGTGADSAPAQGQKLYAKWLGVGRDADAQKSIVDDLDKLDTAHPDSDPLTALTVSFANTAGSTDLRNRLRDLATKTMTSPMAVRMAAASKAQAGAEAKLASLAGKPFVLNATTVDGKPFSTADYKGKVVLVDFWATWCGPCKAGLPEVKEIYGKYHDKGLEIVGVSNDYGADTLKEFTAANGMPWVQLLDAPAAADHKWNPTTLGYGIRGIPTMFLVDKKGVLRSVTARSEMQTLIPTLLAE